MKFCVFALLLVCLVVAVYGQDEEDEKPQKDGTWWTNFKERVKKVLSKWRDDIKLLWDDVLLKADDMRSWTSEMFDSFKKKLREWLESRPEVPDDEKNEIETFINKLRVPTEKPKMIDP